MQIDIEPWQIAFLFLLLVIAFVSIHFRNATQENRHLIYETQREQRDMGVNWANQLQTGLALTNGRIDKEVGMQELINRHLNQRITDTTDNQQRFDRLLSDRMTSLDRTIEATREDVRNRSNALGDVIQLVFGLASGGLLGKNGLLQAGSTFAALKNSQK